MIKNSIKNIVFRIIEYYVYFKKLIPFAKVNKWQKIIIFCQDNLGDALFTTPAIRALRLENKNAIIDLVADQRNLEIYLDNPHVNKIYVWNRRLSYKKDLRYLLTKAKEIRKCDYDLALFFEIEPTICNFQALVSAFAGIKIRIGVNPLGEVHYLSKIVPLYEKKYLPEVYGDIIKTIGATFEDSTMEIFPSKRNETEVKQLLYEIGVNPENEKIIVVHTGAMYYGLRKNWGDEKFIKLIKRLDGVGNFTFLLTGSQDEKERIDKLIPQEMIRIINIAGKLSIKGTLLLTKLCQLLITCDTMILHLGVINNASVAAIFGPTNPIKILPKDKKNIRIIQKNLGCVPCVVSNAKRRHKNEGWNFCTNPHKSQCLNDLSVEEVFLVCKEMLVCSEKEIVNQTKVSVKPALYSNNF